MFFGSKRERESERKRESRKERGKEIGKVKERNSIIQGEKILASLTAFERDKNEMKLRVKLPY